jgi:hypothetical protein
LVGLLGRMIMPFARPLPTQDNTRYERRRLCLEWGSNPRSQCLGGQRDFIP